MGISRWESHGNGLGMANVMMQRHQPPWRHIMQTTTAIDMLTPAQTCSQLRLTEEALLNLINAGELPAYNLGGNIRFKVLDVAAANRQLIAA